MLIKGCRREAVVMKCESDIFDEVHFILKPEASLCKASDEDIITKANRIIENCRRYATHKPKNKKQRRFWAKLLWFAFGVACGIAATLLLI